MSEKPKTHRERAEDAIRHHEENRHRYTLANEDPEDQVDAVARLTRPTELLKAAKTLLRLVEGEARDLERLCHQEFATREIAEARAALKLYEPEEE